MNGGEAESTRKKARADKPGKRIRRPSIAREAIASDSSSVTTDERHRMIEEAAYHRAEKRGFMNGDPVQDWLDAEAQIESELRNGRKSPRA